MKKISSLFLCLLLLTSFLTVNVKAEEDDYIHIKRVEDWNELAIDCSLDSYSKDLKVSLDADLVFEEEFMPIPYFNGTFDGNNHSLKGISLNEIEEINGVFRITGEDSVISNLEVEYSLNYLSERVGFVGYNQGKLSNIKVSATLDANDEVGGIVGYNSFSGLIDSCSIEGTIYGKHYVGGLAGINYGIIKDSTNSALINTIVKDEQFDIQTITLETITKTSNSASITDIGGIVGSNYGTIKNCNNEETVGYEHVGYNIGGIAGSSLGLIDSCTNNADVFGRKEIGGIVGQFEPAMSLNFQVDYPTILKREIKNMSNTVDDMIDQVGNMSDDNTGFLKDLSSNLEEAYNAAEAMSSSPFVYDPDTKTFKRSEEYENSRVVLSSSMSNVFKTINDYADANSGYTDIITSDLESFNDYLTVFSNTAVDFADSISNPKPMYEDVSDVDDDLISGGVISNCINNAYIYGDINVGGISGALAEENDLDPEDELSIVGSTSFNATYKIKAIIDNCTNNGTISVKRYNAGGIVGNQDLGLIRNCLNFGLIDAEDAKYIGGIAGNSISTIKNSYARCFISGSEYVGGIAGSGTDLKNNGSIVQIINGNYNVGSILGNYGKISSETVENAEDIEGNWYLYDLAAIDGISYESKAYPITLDEFKELDIDDSLKNIHVYFYDEKHLVSNIEIEYGQSIAINDIATLTGFDCDSWLDLDEIILSNIKTDLMFYKDDSDMYPAISSNEDLALIVLEGKFKPTDIVEAYETKLEPLDISTEYVEYRLLFELSDKSECSKIRIKTDIYSKFDIYVYKNEEWNKVDYQIDGSYSCFEYEENIEYIAIAKVNDYSALLKICGGAALVIVAATFVKKRKNKNKEKVQS